MNLENRRNGEFDYLVERLLYVYLSSYSKFIRKEDMDIPEDAQKQMHKFLYEFLEGLYENPVILDPKLQKDDCFSGGMYKKNSELDKATRSLKKKLSEYIVNFWRIGSSGHIQDDKIYISRENMKLTKAKLEQYVLLGISYEITKSDTILWSAKYPKMVYGWKLLSEQCVLISKELPGIPEFMLLHGVFDLRNVSWNSMYGGFEENEGNLEALETKLLRAGYTYRFYDSTFVLCKEYLRKQEAAFGISYNWKVKHQLSYVFKVPCFRQIASDYEKLDMELKKFLYERCGNCKGCGYCMQLDKKNRSCFAVPMQMNGEEKMKCPLFPNLSFKSLSLESIESIMKMLKYVEML